MERRKYTMTKHFSSTRSIEAAQAMPALRSSIVQLLLLIVVVPLSFTCSLAQQFTSVAESLGIVHSLQSTDGWGGGISFFDFDNDGLDDITLIQENDSIQLYKNTGGSFQKLPSIAFVEGRTRHAIWVDYDNDGDNDLFITTSGGGNCILLRNNGGFQFEDVTLEAGLAGLTTFNYGATFGDYDRDGDLDLYLCRYIMTGAQSDPQVVNALFRNNGDGTFTNVAFDLWVHNNRQPSFMGVWIDVNHDLWPDLYVINDRNNWENALYINNGDGTFTENTEQWNALMSNDDPMTATFADFDNDGDLDIYSTNTGHDITPSRLLVNQNGETFSEEGVLRGVGLTEWGWGASFIDYDNDTNLDLFVATGWTNGFGSSSGEVSSVMYLNDGNHHFDQAPNGFFDSDLVAASYGVAIGDIENDGYPDIAVINAKNYNSFLLQNAGGDNHFIKITLEGTVSNRMGIGAWIEVCFAEQKRVHYTRCGENYCGQSSQHHIFGLGEQTHIDSVVVAFPSGHTDVFYDITADQHITLVEGASLPQGIESLATQLCPGESTQLVALANEDLVWSNGSEETIITVDQPGAYYYTYISEFGIPVTSDTVDVFVESEPVFSLEYTNPNCNGDADGQIQMLIDEPDFQFFVNGLPAGWSIDGLSEGAYLVELVSPFGCLYNDAVELIAPDEFEYITSYPPIACHGESTQVSIITFGAQLPIVIGWGSFQEGLLPSGIHTIGVTDNAGCQLFVELNIEEPLPFEIEVAVIDDVFDVQLTGGTPPYSFSIVDPNGNLHDAESPLEFEGNYLIVGVDSQSCEQSTNYLHTISKVDGQAVANLNIYPNPVTETLFVDALNVQLSRLALYDTSGRLILANDSVGGYTIHLPVAQLAPGMYILHVTTLEGVTFSRRIFRQ